MRAEPAPTPLADVERQHILGTLDSLNGNILRTARALGIDRRTLYRKLHGYGYEFSPPVWFPASRAQTMALGPKALPNPRALPDSNDSVKTIRALEEQLRSHVAVKGIEQ